MIISRPYCSQPGIVALFALTMGIPQGTRKFSDARDDIRERYEVCMGGRAIPMQHLLDSTFEALHAHELPRFALQRGRLNISSIPAEGYRIETTIRSTPFRFTAILYEVETTYLVGIECQTQGKWTILRIETSELSVLPALSRQFLGFVLSVVEAEPSVCRIEFAAPLDDHTQRDFYHTAVLCLARILNATYHIHASCTCLGTY